MLFLALYFSLRLYHSQFLEEVDIVFLILSSAWSQNSRMKVPLFYLATIVIAAFIGIVAAENLQTSPVQESVTVNDDYYQEETEEVTNYSPTFHGDPCTEDCSGHEAGYEWALDKGIDDPDDCGGNSESFIEGCESAAEEIQQEREEYEEDQYYDSISY